MTLSMRLASAARVIRVRPVTVADSYGESVGLVWDGRADRALVPGARVQERSTSDSPALGTPDRRLAERVLFAPGVADVEPDDRIEVAGEVWRIDGEVLVKRGISPRSTFTTATLRRVTGA